MLPSFASFHLVGPANADGGEVAREMLRQTFAEIPVRESPTLAHALAQSAGHDPELLLLLAPDASDFPDALAARDRRGLPRWTIITRGAAGPESAIIVDVAAEDWTAPVLLHAVNAAARLHAFRRDNARLRGDLCTIGRRLAHDLRTPLNCISTASEALSEHKADPATTALFTQSITEAVNEAATLIGRLSSVLTATANPLERRPLAMDEVVWGALQRFETRIQHVGATIAKPSTWPEVTGVPALIEVVWSNLIANSLQHGGGRPRIELGWDRVNDEHRFWVRDSGQGVTGAKSDLLFHPFDRLNELNAPRGYGLAIVHRVIDLHGERCGYETEPAPGGTFFFTLAAA